MMRYRWLVFIALTFLMVQVGSLHAQAAASSRSISAQELEGETQIIGLLGLPLGELASVKAQVVRVNTKGDGRQVRVLEVDGRLLPAPIVMKYSIWQWGNIADKGIPTEGIVKLRVYETGGMVGVPIDAMRETVFVQTEGWAFETSLVLVNLE